MSQSTAASRTFFSRANDIRCRDWSARLSRFLRARLHRLASAGLLFADDPRVCSAWKHGWEASHYLRLLRWRDTGFRPRCVYDIGAHVGCWSEMAEATFHPEQIFLFEPQHEFHDQARTRQPEKANWEVVPLALGDRDEIQTMNVTENPAASSLLTPDAGGVPASWGATPVRREEVRVVRLDGLVPARAMPSPDLVKIDVQGYERAVLAGGKETLSEAQRIVIEVSLQPIYRGQALLPEVVQTLSHWGFELDDISEGCRPWPGPVSQVDLWLKRAK
ncbi:MAG: FkbM family methyltransferase [Verrucomicrobiales bacterium]|nr:FkbM family methyltransferase [Verrucomicrobiales bacterium]